VKYVDALVVVVVAVFPLTVSCAATAEADVGPYAGPVAIGGFLAVDADPSRCPNVCDGPPPVIAPPPDDTWCPPSPWCVSRFASSDARSRPKDPEVLTTLEAEAPPPPPKDGAPDALLLLLLLLLALLIFNDLSRDDEALMIRLTTVWMLEPPVDVKAAVALDCCCCVLLYPPPAPEFPVVGGRGAKFRPP
jgi:hypothetical protein